ncbi:GlcG/HbpS family heme-binding protein [Gluconacetobacter sp. Hr-1-5]|uniref:GlcG/HbpS family heme-binding protein n=1 Tax=Gluconacetobacter sp. Hr-1-5 TaxID=3395370 RepID=UPI003B5202D5
MNVKTKAGLLILSVGIVTATANVSPVAAKGSSLDLATSLAFIDQAKRAADADHAHIAIAIVDAGGNLISFQKMDGTQLGSVELAIRKAKTSVSFARPSADMERALNSGNYMIATLPNALPAGGGYPIVINNELVGALGLSGGEGETDARLAQSAVTTILRTSKPRAPE